MACPNCQRRETLINNVCNQCGFNVVKNRFSWIKVHLDKTQHGMSLDDHVAKHLASTRKAPMRT